MQETQELWVQSLSQEDLLVEKMAPHPCILAWKILWTEEAGRLQSQGSQRDTTEHARTHKHTHTQTHTHIHIINYSHCAVYHMPKTHLF